MKKTYRMKLLALLAAVVMLLTAVTGCANGETMNTEVFANLINEANRQWTVGFGQAVLPYPEETSDPTYIAGYNQAWEITGILDEQRATAVWIDCGGKGILIIGIDCVGLSNKYVEDIRTDLAAECAEWGCVSVNVYSTHTHAGIDTLGLWGEVAVDGKNKEFQQTLVEGAFEAARLAYENRRPGTLTCTSSASSRMTARPVSASSPTRHTRNPCAGTTPCSAATSRAKWRTFSRQKRVTTCCTCLQPSAVC